MADKAKIGVPNIFPSFRYEDAPKAIEWLNKAFGFEKQFVVPGENSTVAHAQLRLGPGMIMMGSRGKPDPKNTLGDRTLRYLCGGARHRSTLCARQGRRSEDRAPARGHRVRLARIFRARLRWPSVELRHL
jgi:hypothetical protein